MRRKKPPKIVQMGLSGIARSDLDDVVEDLEDKGARDILVSLDEDTMRDFPTEGKFYIVDYVK